MEKISVIVPVYNVEEYLSQCVDSLLNQSYRNLEVILVDDGSTDSSPSICDKYASRDSRVRVIHKKNGGQSSARNKGLSIASGEYIAFADGDDWVEPTMYEDLLTNLKKYNADISVCGIYRCDSITGDRISSTINGDVVCYENFYSYCDNLFAPCQYEIRFEVWNKLFKHEVLKGISFKEGQIFEEIYYMRCVLERTRKVVCLSSPLYDYRVGRPGSTISSFKISRLSKVDEIDAFIKLFANENKKHLENKYVDYAMNSILELYKSARNHHASKEDEVLLINRFLRYFSYAKDKSMKIRTKYWIFWFSPNLYILSNLCVSKMRSL